MAHLYSGHAVLFRNPDDGDFAGQWMTQNDINLSVDALIPVIQDDERDAAQRGINVHQQHLDPTITITLVGQRTFRLVKGLT